MLYAIIAAAATLGCLLIAFKVLTFVGYGLILLAAFVLVVDWFGRRDTPFR